MTEKRYYAHKHLLQENKVHDKICHNFMNIDETVEHMNNQYWKYKQLKEENEQLKQTISDWTGSYDGLYEDVKRLEKENENFKKALRVVYSTKLTEPTKHTIEQIAKHCRVDLE